MHVSFKNDFKHTLTLAKKKESQLFYITGYKIFRLQLFFYFQFNKNYVLFFGFLKAKIYFFHIFSYFLKTQKYQINKP